MLKAFENRKYTKRVNEDGTYDTEVTTSNKALDEMYTCIKHNVWFEYFLNASSNIGENWIDFELEISKVIQALDSARFQVQAGGSVRNVEKYESQMLMNILKCSKGVAAKCIWEFIPNRCIYEILIYRVKYVDTCIGNLYC